MAGKFVVLGDAHVRNRTWPRVELYGDAFLAVREVVDAARVEGATLVATGDLFDAGLGHDAPRCVQEILDATSGIGDVVYAVGNHDRTGAAGGARNPEWVSAVLDRKYRHRDELGDCLIGDNWWHEECAVREVRGVRYAVIHHQTSEDAFDAKVAELERIGDPFDVLVCHQGMSWLLGVKGAYEIDASRLAPRLKALGCRLCCCGHVHIAKEKEFDGVLFLSPGHTCRETVNDSVIARFPVVTLGDEVTVEWRALQHVRTVECMTAAGEDNEAYDAVLRRIEELKVSSLDGRLPPALAAPLLSVTYVNRPGFRRLMEDAAGSDVYLDLTAVPDEESLRADETPESNLPVKAGELAADIERITTLHTVEGPVRDALMAIQNGADPSVVIDERITAIMAS